MADRLKELNLLKRKKEVEISNAQIREMEWHDTVESHQKALKAIENRIQNVKEGNDGIDISDHAVVRYMERVLKIDIEALKKQIVPEQYREFFIRQTQLNASTVKIKNEIGAYKLILAHGIVVTILSDDMSAHKK